MRNKIGHQTQMNWMTRVGVAAVFGTGLNIAALNIVGWTWSVHGWAGWWLAGLAAALELFAFIAFEHIAQHFRAGWRHWHKGLLAVLGLAVALCLNIEGGHRGLNYLLAPIEAERIQIARTAQTSLDARHAEIEFEIASLEAQVQAAAASRPNPETTPTARQRAWLDNYEAVTARPLARIADLRAEKDALPLVVEVDHAFPAWGPYAATGALAFISVFGLTMLGVRVRREPVLIQQPAIQEIETPPAPVRNPLRFEHKGKVFDLSNRQVRRALKRWHPELFEADGPLYLSRNSL